MHLLHVAGLPGSHVHKGACSLSSYRAGWRVLGAGFACYRVLSVRCESAHHCAAIAGHRRHSLAHRAQPDMRVDQRPEDTSMCCLEGQSVPMHLAEPLGFRGQGLGL